MDINTSGEQITYPVSKKPKFKCSFSQFPSTLSECNPDLFHDFVNPNLCIEIIANSCHHSDRVEVIRAVGQILDLLKELPPPSRGGDQRRSVVNVTKAHLFSEYTRRGLLFIFRNKKCNVNVR